MAKTRVSMAPTRQSPEMLEGIIEGLFSRHDPNPWPPSIGLLKARAGSEIRVTDEELAGIPKTLSVGKAPGPNGALNLALKVAIAEAPGKFSYAEMSGRGSSPIGLEASDAIQEVVQGFEIGYVGFSFSDI